VNLSTRANVQTGDNVTIMGFILEGAPVRKKVLVRALGPSLAVNGTPLAGRLEDPVLKVAPVSGYNVSENDDWNSSPQRDGIVASSLAPTDPRESAQLRDFATTTGDYSTESVTAIMSGKNGGTGQGILELYDLAPASGRLANISTRSLVGADDNAMIGGFIVAGGADGRGARVLIRGIGPSLPGVSNPLLDPTIELRDRNGSLVSSNDDWKSNQSEIMTTGIPPRDDRESALVTDVAADNYTAVLRGSHNTTGVGLIEIYHLQ
jgi:hypothetical protein